MGKTPGRGTRWGQGFETRHGNAQVRVYETAFVDKIGHVDASNSNYCTMSTNKDILLLESYPIPNMRRINPK